MTIEDLPTSPPEAEILCHAEALIAYARQKGIVVTIDLVPKQPLAQGNYEMVASVRPAREPAA